MDDNYANYQHPILPIYGENPQNIQIKAWTDALKKVKQVNIIKYTNIAPLASTVSYKLGPEISTTV